MCGVDKGVTKGAEKTAGNLKECMCVHVCACVCMCGVDKEAEKSRTSAQEIHRDVSSACVERIEYPEETRADEGEQDIMGIRALGVSLNDLAFAEDVGPHHARHACNIREIHWSSLSYKESSR